MKIILIFLVLILFGGGAWLMSLDRQDDDSAVVDTETTETQTQMQKTEEKGNEKMDQTESDTNDQVLDNSPQVDVVEAEMAVSAGTYESYSAEKLVAADSGDVVLFFHAAWCPTCRGLEKNIEANLSAIPEGVSILKVDYDNSTDLKRKYKVTYQHTFVQVDSAGNQITKWSGSPTLSSLVSKIQ